MAVDVNVALGQLVLCLDVKDLAAAVRFHQELGFDLQNHSDDSATLCSLPPHVYEDPYGFPIRLRQAHSSNLRLAFFCDDVAGVADSIRKLGIEVLESSDGASFVDPDARRVVLMEKEHSVSTDQNVTDR